jgi:hypothetical protein
MRRRQCWHTFSFRKQISPTIWQKNAPKCHCLFIDIYWR